MQKTIKSFFEKVIKKILYGYGDYKKHQKIERDIEIKLNLERDLDAYKIAPPSNYYQKTDDFLENIRLYEQALERLKEKYKPHVLDVHNIFGDDLLRREIKRERYCEKYNLNAEELDLITKEVQKKAKEEVELAQLNFLIRDDNYTKQDLARALELEKVYGSSKRAAELEKKLEAFEKKDVSRKPIDYAKWDVDITLMYNIKYNINVLKDTPTEDKFLINWRKKLDLLKENLKAKGIYLDKNFEADLKHEYEIKKTWKEICDQFEKQRIKDLGFEKFYEELDRKYPRFDFDFLAKELLKGYPDGRMPHMSKEEFDKKIRVIYEKQTEEYQKRRPWSLEEYTMNAQKYIKHRIDQTNADKKIRDSFSKFR
jgi:hypothetical protein